VGGRPGEGAFRGKPKQENSVVWRETKHGGKAAATEGRKTGKYLFVRKKERRHASRPRISTEGIKTWGVLKEKLEKRERTYMTKRIREGTSWTCFS